MTAYGRNIGRIRRYAASGSRAGMGIQNARSRQSHYLLLRRSSATSTIISSWPQPSGVCPAQREYPPRLSHNARRRFTVTQEARVNTSVSQRHVSRSTRTGRSCNGRTRSSADPLTHRDRSHAANPVYPRRQKNFQRRVTCARAHSREAGVDRSQPSSTAAIEFATPRLRLCERACRFAFLVSALLSGRGNVTDIAHVHRTARIHHINTGRP